VSLCERSILLNSNFLELIYNLINIKWNHKLIKIKILVYLTIYYHKNNKQNLRKSHVVYANKLNR
jgi:hypothetical protein